MMLLGSSLARGNVLDIVRLLDSGLDAGSDSGLDSVLDSGSDFGLDSVLDSGSDAGLDSAMDSVVEFRSS